MLYLSSLYWLPPSSPSQPDTHSRVIYPLSFSPSTWNFPYGATPELVSFSLLITRCLSFPSLGSLIISPFTDSIDPDVSCTTLLVDFHFRMSWRAACLLLLFSFTSLAVKRGDFKTCAQSAFCKRHRAISVSCLRLSVRDMCLLASSLHWLSGELG